MNMVDEIANKIANFEFDGGDFLDDAPRSLGDFDGTEVEPLIDDIINIVSNNVDTYKLDYVGTSETCDGGAVEIHFDLIWIKDGELFSLPFKIESDY